MPTNITYKNNTLTTVTPGQSKILKTSGKYLEDDLIVSNSSSNQVKGVTITPTTSSQTQTVTPDSAYEGLSAVTVTVNPIPSSYIIPSGTINISSNTTGIDVTSYANAVVNVSPSLTTASVTPSETAQNITPGAGYDGLSSVTVNGITNTYVGSGVPQRTSSDIITQIKTNQSSGNNYYSITIPQGYYSNSAKNITMVNREVIPSETSQQVSSTSSSLLDTVTVAAITSTYVGSGVTTQSSLTVNANTITANAGYYADAVTYTMPYATARPMTLTQATPGINVNSTGLVTATNNQRKTTNIRGIETAGYAKSTSPSFEVTQEASSATYQLPTLPAQSFTPSSTTQTVASTGKYMLGDITVQPIPSEYVVPSGTLTIEDDGIINVANYSNIEVPAATPYAYVNLDYGNEYMNMDVEPSGRVGVSFYTTDFDVQVDDPGWVSSSTYNMLISAYQEYQLPTLPAQTITPSESTQTINSTSKWMTGNVTVNPITSTYVGSGVTTNPTITVSGPSVTIPAGYYSSQQTKTVASGSVSTPSTTITANPTVSVSNSGLITASVTGSSNVAPSVSAGYISSGTAGTISVTGSTTLQLTTQGSTTVTPSTSTQTVSVTGKYMTGNVTVNPIPSQYIVPSGTYTISSVDSTNTFNVTNYASAKVSITDADSIAY